MKLTRTALLWILGALAIVIILYGLAKQFIGFSVNPGLEKTLFDFIVIGAIGILLYNRQLTKEESKDNDESREEKSK